MELRQLEAFYWIVRLGSFSAAARTLNTTQPAISMRIRDLQHELGVSLFDTSGRKAQVTSKGRDLFDYAESMLNLASTIYSRMGDRTKLSGRIRVGATETVALTWLPALASYLNETYPQVILELDIGLTMDLWKQLAKGRLEVIMLPGPVLEPGMEWRHLGSIDYCWMASPSLGLSRGSLSAKDLEPYSIISLPKASSLHEDSERWFRSNGAEPNRVDFCNSLSVVASLTTAGLGISLLPPDILSDAVSSSDLQVLDVEPKMPPLDFFVVHSRKPVSPLSTVVSDAAMKMTTFREPGRIVRTVTD